MKSEMNHESLPAEKREGTAHVLPKSMGGGPMGLGDPDDRSLRKVEVDVVIPKMMKDEVKKFCETEVKAFVDCSKQYGLLLPFKCRQQNREMQKCTMKWYQDQEYRKVVTERYLQERSEFRRTGVPVHKYERGHSGH